MNKTSHTKTLLTLIILGIVVVLAADAALFYSIENKNLDVSVIAAQNGELLAQEKLTSSFQSIGQATTADRAVVDSLVLAQADQVSFVGELSDLAKTVGVSVTVSNLGSSEDSLPASGTDYLTANLRIQGNWVEVFHYLMLVESMPVSVGIDTLQFQRDTASKSVLWDGSFSIKVLTNKE